MSPVAPVSRMKRYGPWPFSRTSIKTRLSISSNGKVKLAVFLGACDPAAESARNAKAIVAVDTRIGPMFIKISNPLDGGCDQALVANTRGFSKLKISLHHA